MKALPKKTRTMTSTRKIAIEVLHEEVATEPWLADMPMDAAGYETTGCYRKD
jgi:hypothetical protein